MPLGDADIAAILTDLKARGEAVDVVLGGTTVQGVLRNSQDVLQGAEGEQVERVPVVQIKAGLAGLAIGSALTVNGVSCKVRDVINGDDRGMVDVVLAT